MSDNKISHAPEVQPEHKVLFSSEFITVKKTSGYFYAERKGIDSVAFVLFANNADDEKRIGVVREFKIPINKFLPSAFGGSIDEEKYFEDLNTLVIDEVLEESGFTVTKEDIDYYGKVLVSTQMNQFCHLFAVRVDKFRQGLKTTNNPREIESTVEWLTLPEVFILEDWKAITIVAKRMISSPTIIQVTKINETPTQVNPVNSVPAE